MYIGNISYSNFVVIYSSQIIIRPPTQADDEEEIRKWHNEVEEKPLKNYIGKSIEQLRLDVLDPLMFHTLKLKEFAGSYNLIYILSLIVSYLL